MKNKRYTRIISILLITVMAITLMIGCSQKNEDDLQSWNNAVTSTAAETTVTTEGESTEADATCEIVIEKLLI